MATKDETIAAKDKAKVMYFLKLMKELLKSRACDCQVAAQERV